MKNKLKKNFLYQITYQILVLALPFLISPYISRTIGANGLGVYTYYYNIAYYFVLIAMLGILNYGNRTIAKVREDREMLNKEFSSMIILHAALSFTMLLLYILFILFFADNRLYASLECLYVISAIFDITWFYYGLEHFKMAVIRNISVKILTLISIFTFIKSPSDIWKYVLIMSCSFLVSQLILWIPLKKYVSFVKVTRQDVQKHFKPMTILFVPTIAVSLYKHMDKVMIGAIASKTQLGFYENSESLVRVALSIIESIGTVMLPQMSNLVANKNMKQIYAYIQKSMRYVLLVAFGMSFGLAAVADTFAPLFWGEEFYAVGVLIQYLACTVPFIAFANIIRTQFLLPFERDKAYMFSVIAGAVVNLVINAVLIPQYGAAGACIATVIAEGTVCLIQAFQVRRELAILRYIIDLAPFAASGLLMYFIVDKIQLSGVSAFIRLLIQIAAGAGVYAICIAVILFIKKDEIVQVISKRIKKRG